MRIYRFIFILTLLFIVVPAKYLKVAADEGENKLVDLLKIKPGMAILDIGTGAGYYAYKFAEKLKGTGRVFATDIKTEYINYVAEEARKRGLKNLYPVLVNATGVDEFYSKHKYDLIFLTGIYGRDPVSYFKEMRNFLAHNGRLVMLDYKTLCFNFFKEDFTDFEGLIKDLSREPTNSPFYTGLRESTRKLIKQKTRPASDKFLKDAIVADFNRMLVNPLFFASFLKGRIFKREVLFTPAERDFADRQLQLLDLRRKGGFDLTQKELDTGKFEVLGITRLNKLFLIQRFRKYLSTGKAAPYLSKAVIDRSIKADKCARCLEEWMATAREAGKEVGYKRIFELPFFLEKRDLQARRVLEEAGYRLEHEYGLIPFRIILVFKANKDALK